MQRAIESQDTRRRGAGIFLSVLILPALVAGCGGTSGPAGRKVTLVLGAYTTPREAYGKAIIPAFQAWQTFWHVTLPTIRWGLLYGISLTLARALGEFGAVLVVSAGVSGLTETATLFIFRSLDDRNHIAAYSMAMVLALISFTILMLMELFKRRADER